MYYKNSSELAAIIVLTILRNINHKFVSCLDFIFHILPFLLSLSCADSSLLISEFEPQPVSAEAGTEDEFDPIPVTGRKNSQGESLNFPLEGAGRSSWS